MKGEQQEEFFERFIDKQTSSTSPIHYILYDVIEKKTRTVNKHILIDLESLSRLKRLKVVF